MAKQNKLNLILTILFTSILLLSILSIVNQSQAQENGVSKSFQSNFEMFESTELQGNKINITTIDLSLPSSSWNTEGLELNFTDIKLSRETVIIEDNSTVSTMYINKFNHGLAVQINISEFTTIYGVEIYIHNASTASLTPKDVFVQINNYSTVSEIPTNIITGSQIKLNVTSDEGWNKQIFPSPIDLPVGNYCLVLNGTDIGTAPQPLYSWYNNDDNPKYPNLFVWNYDGGIWQSGEKGKTLLHKLIQRTNKTYNPKDIEMQVDIDGEFYNITNGPIMGSGELIIPDLYYFLNETNFHITVHNNRSVELFFNLDYHTKISRNFLTQGSVVVSENLDNVWTLNPNIVRYQGNSSIKFNYPQNWYNVVVKRNEIDITSEVTINNVSKYILIPNNTILSGASWEITANSPNIEFTLNFPNIEWEVGQKLQFSVKAPIIQGNLTFVLINTLDFPEINQTKEVTSEETFFAYNIPTNFRNGSYTAKIFWNNLTDAGVQSQVFQITIPETSPTPDSPDPNPTSPEPIDPLLIIGIVVASVAATISIFVSYRLLQSYRNKRAEEELKKFNKCMDALKLDYLMVTDKRSGLNIYEQKFTSKVMNGTLISGFLQAIHQFGIELIKVEDQSQTIKLEYANSIIIMTEFVNLRLILIMKESPSRNFLFSLEDLAYEIYHEYGALIEDFKGDIKPFHGIEEFLRKHLNISFIYPLKLASKASSDAIKINQDEREYINKALSFMKQTKKNYFYISSLLPEKTCSPNDIEHIMDLIEKDIFHPIHE